MHPDVDLVLMESVVLGASEALDGIADELLQLRRGWVDHGAAPHAVAWLDGVIQKAGWWSGRLAATCDLTRRE
jgi:hypothetical protein